ncbi:MAG TPA: serine hydrolase domain-containing protein [Gemmatimonadaceae bacterium]
MAVLSLSALTAGCQSLTASGAHPQHDMAAGARPPGPDAVIADSVRRILDRAAHDSAFPGAIAVVGTRSRVITTYAAGHLDWAPSPTPDLHTLWDLASLTKVIGLTSGVMQLVDRGLISLDAPVQQYLPAWTGRNKALVTIRHLLTHTSGLPAFKPYDEITHDPDSLAALMFGTQLDTLPGARMVYSDIGAYMMGRVLERITGETLDGYLHAHVFQPAGMTETMYNPPASLIPRIAPTEFDPRRGGLVRGKVHDERAYYLGGVSAHAGIFSSAHDLTRFAQMYLNDGVIDGVRILPSAQIAAFTTRQVADRALGWQKPDGTNSAGHHMSPEAFGHTGFTGTSIWMDPTNDVFIILLSNRVDPTRANTRIGRVRVALADAVMSALPRAHKAPASP